MRARPINCCRVRLVCSGTGKDKRERKTRGCVDPRIGHVVPVAKESDAQTVKPSMPFNQGEAIAKHLAGVEQV